MGTLKPVGQVDVQSLVELEGYHPEYFVKTDGDSLDGMKTIKESREKSIDEFLNFDDDILKFANSGENVQSEAMQKATLQAIAIIEDVLPKYEGGTLHLYGSAKIGYALQNADIDLCWLIPVKGEIESDVMYPMAHQGDFEPKSYLNHAKNKISGLSCLVDDARLISARVPILQFSLDVDGFKMDCNLSLNNIIGIHNTHLLAQYAKIDDRLPTLARILKTWGKRAGIIDPRNGYLNSYSMVLMIVHFLQCGVSPPILPNLNIMYPGLFDGTPDIDEIEEAHDSESAIEMGENDTPIGDLLIGFLRYFGFFCYESDGIFLSLGCVGPKPRVRDQFFLEEVYDGFTVPKNLTADKVKFLKSTFMDAFALLFERPILKKFLDNEKKFLSGSQRRH